MNRPGLVLPRRSELPAEQQEARSEHQPLVGLRSEGDRQDADGRGLPGFLGHGAVSVVEVSSVPTETGDQAAEPVSLFTSSSSDSLSGVPIFGRAGLIFTGLGSAGG